VEEGNGNDGEAPNVTNNGGSVPGATVSQTTEIPANPSVINGHQDQSSISAPPDNTLVQSAPIAGLEPVTAPATPRVSAIPSYASLGITFGSKDVESSCQVSAQPDQSVGFEAKEESVPAPAPSFSVPGCASLDVGTSTTTNNAEAAPQLPLDASSPSIQEPAKSYARHGFGGQVALNHQVTESGEDNNSLAQGTIEAAITSTPQIESQLAQEQNNGETTHSVNK
jgi:hypothetical protein